MVPHRKEAARRAGLLGAACSSWNDVPLIVFVDVSELRQADVIETPSANRSTHEP